MSFKFVRGNFLGGCINPTYQHISPQLKTEKQIEKLAIQLGISEIEFIYSENSIKLYRLDPSKCWSTADDMVLTLLDMLS